MKVYSFFRAVAEGVAAQGLKELAEEVPGGKYFTKLAEFVFARYKQLRQQAQFRDDMREMVADEFATQQQNAKAAVEEFTPPGTPPEDRITLELFLAQIPAAARKTFARPEDPSGRTVPAAFSLSTPDDVLRMLPPAPPKLRPGMPLPGRAGWVVDSLIGTGGFGEVWYARHTRMTALTGAVKVCPARSGAALQHEGDLINRVMAAGEHPNVVRLLDADLDGEVPWLLFEHVAGGDLAAWVHELQGKPPEKRVKQVVAALGQLASAVGHFHRLNPAVVHRDLKPANILIDKTNKRLRITDFGIGAVSAKDAIEAEVRGTATRGGRLQSSLRGSHTPLYASPQQREGANPDPRDDVHALGVIAYQMLTGDLNRGAGADLPDDLREAAAPEPLVELIAKCVAQKPDRRPRDGNELAARLAEIKLGAAEPPEPPPVPPTAEVVEPRPAAAFAWGKPRAIGAIASAIALVLAIGLIALIGSGPKPTYTTKPSRGGDGYSTPNPLQKAPAGKPIY